MVVPFLVVPLHHTNAETQMRYYKEIIGKYRASRIVDALESDGIQASFSKGFVFDEWIIKYEHHKEVTIDLYDPFN